jgi:hypothetical protein
MRMFLIVKADNRWSCQFSINATQVFTHDDVDEGQQVVNEEDVLVGILGSPVVSPWKEVS